MSAYYSLLNVSKMKNSVKTTRNLVAGGHFQSTVISAIVVSHDIYTIVVNVKIARGANFGANYPEFIAELATEEITAN